MKQAYNDIRACKDEWSNEHIHITIRISMIDISLKSDSNPIMHGDTHSCQWKDVQSHSSCKQTL